MNAYTNIDHSSIPSLSASFIRNHMRRHNITIRTYAETFSITLQRVREYRASGLPRGLRAWEFLHNCAEITRH